MKPKHGKRALSLLLAAVLCLTLLPLPALAGSQEWLEAFWYDNNRMESYGYGTEDGCLITDAAGGINLSVSAFVSVPGSCTIDGVFMVDADSRAERYDLLDPAYGGENEVELYEDTDPETNVTDYSIGVWLQHVAIPNAVLGDYRLKVVTSTATFYTEPYSDEYYSTDGVVHVVDGSDLGPVITMTALPDGRVGEPYSCVLTGTAVTSWSAAGLPAGLSLSGNTISGTPTEAGMFTVTVTASSGTDEVSRDFSLTIAEPRTFTVDFYLNGGYGESGVQYTGIQVSAGQTFTWPADPTLPGCTFVGWKSGATVYSTAQPGPTVTANMRFTAQWTAKPDVTVTAPGLEKVIGFVWLTGTCSNGTVVWLWDHTYEEASSLDGIRIRQSDLYRREYVRLDLRACVNGEATVIAEYDGTVDGDTGSVALTSTGVSYTALKGLEVAGLTYGTDYYVSYVRDSSGKGVSFKRLVSSGETYQVKLYSNYWSPNRALYDWDAVYSVQIQNAMLSITPRPLPDPSVTVTGTVTLNGKPVIGATVVSSQYYQQVDRTQTAVTDGNGVYRLKVYPGSGVSLSVTNGEYRFYLRSGSYVSAPDAATAEVVNDIALASAILHAEVRVAGFSDSALVSRYLTALNDTPRLSVSNSANAETETDCLYLSLRSELEARSSWLYYATADSGTLTCTLSGRGVEDTTAQTVLSGGVASVTLTPILKAGVLASLSASVTGSYFFAWYDAAGAYAGRSDLFTLDDYARDIAAVCPEGVQPGAYAVILLHSASYGTVAFTTLATLPLDQRVKTWPVTVSAGSIAELEPCTVDSVTSNNARYVTQPASTLNPSVISFAEETDLITFTGSIGLDAGLSNGKLSALYIDTRGSGYDNTAPIQAIVVNGKLYEPYVNWNVSMFGYYSVDLRTGGQPIDLPCEYTIYCKPGSIDWDMKITMTAYGTYEGGIMGQGAFSGELVGSVVVSRPGASIYTLSSFVCSDTITVSGTARRGEAVSIYDNGVFIGSATGGTNGSWTALVPLYGTDPSLATAHELTVVTASGIRSEELTVVHQADGPELTSFKMSWNGREINVGDAYVYAWGMQDTTFTAVLEHPEKLEVLTEWGEDVRVVFKVCTTDGEVRFLPASGTGPTFTAAIDGVLRTSVTRAEAIFIPAKLNTGFDEELGCYVLGDEADFAEMNAELERTLANIGEQSGQGTMTPADAKAILDSATADSSWSIRFDGGTAAAEGAMTGCDTASLQELYDQTLEAGLQIDAIEQRCGDDTLSTAEWLRSAVRAADGTAGAVITGGMRYYRTEEDLRAAEAYAAERAEKVMQSADGSRVSYIWSDLSHDESGRIDGGTYQICFSYIYGLAGFYTEQLDAMFVSGFTSDALEEALAPVQTQETVLRTAAADMNGQAAAPTERAGNAQEPPAPATEQQSSAQSSSNPLTMMNSGDYGNTLSMLSNLTHWVKPLTGAVGTPLGVVGGALGLWSWKEQKDGLEQMIYKTAYEDGQLLRYFVSPCFHKLDKEGKNAVISRYLDWCWTSALKNGISAYHWLLNTELTAINTTILVLGCAGSLETFGFSAFGAVAVTTVTTGIGVSVDKGVTKILGEYNQCRRASQEAAKADIDSIIRAHAHDTGDEDCEGKDSKGRNGKNFKVGNDPSGVVYEGVIENPIEGATVTLYYATDDSGTLLTESSALLAKQLVPASDVSDLIPSEAVQTTGADGRFQWGVPEGLWYVTAEYAGRTGDSSGDAAATVRGAEIGGESYDLLPVLPVQLDVNIPLVDAAAPYVESVRFTNEGIYVSFSKYMDETTVLDASSYGLFTAGDEALAVTAAESAEQGHAPANRDAAETTYTRTVLLRASALPEDAELRLTVSGTVRSYAGTPMGTDCTVSGAVTAQEPLETPVITPASGTVARGTEVSITGPEGAAIFYTTDGSATTAESRRYERPFAVTNDMTVRAVAVRAGYADSAVAEARYTVALGELTVAVRVVDADGNPLNGLTLSLGGRSAVTEYGVAQFRSVQPGTWTVSFAGNGDYKAASGTVTVTDGSVVLVLRLEEQSDEPGPTPDMPESGTEPEPEPIPVFEDVEEGSYYFDAVRWAVANGITEGTGETTFSPNAECTRAQMVTFLWRAAGMPEPGLAENPFTDVDERAYYYKAVLWAYENGITLGTGGTSFSPDDAVTRSQSVTFLFRALSGRAGAENPFADVREGAFYYEAVLWAAENGITFGTSDTTFSPDDDCLRAQIVTFLYRAYHEE